MFGGGFYIYGTSTTNFINTIVHNNTLTRSGGSGGWGSRGGGGGVSNNAQVYFVHTNILKNNAENNATTLLGELDLIHLKDRYPGQISGGERQRVAVLRALVNFPKIILADEPTGNLDKDNSIKLLELFKTIKNNFNTTIIVATHDEFVKKYTNRNFNLDSGVLTEI